MPPKQRYLVSRYSSSPLGRPFPAQPRLLDPAKGGQFGGDDPLVDPHHAVFEPLGHSPHPGDVAAIEVGGQAIGGVVGQRNGLGFRLEAHQGGDRARRSPRPEWGWPRVTPVRMVG